MDSLFAPPCVPVRVTINKLNFFPNIKMPRFVSVLRNCGGLRTSKPYISVVFPDVYFAALTWKQHGVVYKIPCECGKVYIGETGRAMQDRIKEHNRDIRLARTQTSAVSEHANETGHLSIWKKLSLLLVTLTGTHVES